MFPIYLAFERRLPRSLINSYKPKLALGQKGRLFAQFSLTAHRKSANGQVY